MAQARVTPRTVIAVTGSAGKTTTKEMIASILQRRWNTYKTLGNGNLPSYIARQRRQLRPAHRAVVLEFGMSRFGHIGESCRIIQPDLGVITSVGTAHIGNVGGTVRGVAKAKSELIRGLRPAGSLFINADDPNSKLLDIRNFKGKLTRVGTGVNVGYRAFGIRQGPTGISFQVRLKGKSHRFYIPVLGKHNVLNALLAIAVADRLGFTAVDIAAGLRTYQKLRSRLAVFPLKQGARVVDDSYSSNPDAVRAALDVLASLGKGRKIAVLGSMLEMGAYSRRAHQAVGKYAASKRPAFLFTFGDEALEIVNGAVAAGFPAARAKHFRLRNNLHLAIRTQFRPGTVILVKGSHMMRMWETVNHLKATLGTVPAAKVKK